MAYQLWNPYTISLLVTSGCMFALAAATLGHRTERASRFLFGFLVGIGLWAFGDAIRLAAPTRSAILLWNTVAYAGIVLTPPTLLLFGLEYTGRRRWLRTRYVIGVFGISVLAFGVIVTNPVHSLWFEIQSLSPQTAPPVLSEDWGPVWYFWAVYVYGIVVLVAYLMGRELLTASPSGIHRTQTGLVLGGLLIGSGINLMFVLGLVPFDPTPFAFGLMGIAFGLAMFRYELLTVVPIARDTVLRNLDSGVLVLDIDNRVVDANERLREMFTLEEEIRGTPAAEVFGNTPEIRDYVESAQRGGSTTVQCDDGTRHVRVERSELEDALGTDIGTAFVLTDVTDRVRQQEQLRERTRELERRNEQLDQFASVVSHDLRNPVNVIDGEARLAESTSDPEPHLDTITDATERMETIIEDVLSLARQGDAIGDTEPVTLADVVREAWAFVDSGTATLRVESSITLQADPDRLQELFENLFRNAVEHTSTNNGAGAAATEAHGKADVPVDGIEDRHEGVTVRVGTHQDGFFVADDGPGIPESDRDVIFEAGFTTRSNGTGIGLNIVRSIAEAHGWEISVTESACGGARFEISGVESDDDD